MTACIFWLKNRKPHEWRDVQNINADVGHYILSDKPMTEDEWIATRTRLEPKTIEAKPVNGVASPKLPIDLRPIARPLE